MGDYFKGWRRKVGLLTLLLACVFMGGWVRAETVSDVVRFDFGRRQHRAFTIRNRIHWASYESQCKYWDCPIAWATTDPFDFSIFFTLSEITPVKEYRAWELPYLTAILPLTLLSFFLLLTKPRPSNPKKTVEPISEKLA